MAYTLDINLNDKQMWAFSIVMFFSHNVAFWGLSIFYEICYRTGFLKQYRIQKKKVVDDKLLVWAYTKLFLETALTHFPIFFYILYPAFRRHGMQLSPSTVPSAWTFVWQIGLSVLVFDTCFYWSHRILHHKTIYPYIHKEHHQFTISSGIAAEYSHPIESFINGFATLIVPIKLGIHCSVFFVYLFLRLLETVDAHSGYDLPWSPFRYVSGADRHEYHHAHVSF